jgi:hypothetical protein
MSPDGMQKHRRIILANPAVHSHSWELFFGFGLLFFGIFVLFTSSSGRLPTLTNSQTLYLFVLGGLGAVLLRQLKAAKRGIVGLDVCRPLPLYGFFYFLYYVVTGVLLIFDRQVSQRNLLPIAGLLVVGYIAFWAGLKLSGIKAASGPAGLSASELESWALFAVCKIGVVLVALYYAWRVSIGAFYTHAAFYEQAPTIFASLVDVFSAQFQLPLILLFGLLGNARSTEKIARRARYFLYFYTAGLFAVLVIASQFRMAVTTIIFFLVAKKMSGTAVLKVRHMVLTAALCLVALVAVQGFRNEVRSDDVVAAENQLTFSLERILPSFSSALSNWDEGVQTPTITRAVGQLSFLSEIIDATERGAPHPYGEDIVNTIYSVIPRFLWPNKPVVVPFQVTIRERFGLVLHDDAPGPIVEFFAEGGWAGVFVGFLAFGWILGILTKLTVASGNPAMWIALAWFWSTAVQVETELTLGLATILRNVIAVYLIYRILVALRLWLSPRSQSESWAHINAKKQLAPNHP